MKTTREIRVGIVGMGWAGGAHLEFWRNVPGSQVVALCSERPLDLSSFAPVHPIKAYQDYREMLRDRDIDVIDLCTKPSLHAAQAVAAAQAGKHVIIEKPAVLSRDELTEVSSAVRKAGVQAAVCFELRFSKQFEMSRSLIEQGMLGHIHYAECDYFHGIGSWYGLYRWNQKKLDGGSSLLTAGCHALDVLRMLIDDPVEEVTALSTQSKHADFARYEFPTTTVVLMKTREGRILKVSSCIDALQPYTIRTHLLGSAGTLLDNRLYTEKIHGMRKDWAVLPTTLADSGDVKDLPYGAFFEAVTAAIAAGEPIPRVGLDEAFETHRIIFAADEAATTGKPVRL